MEIVRKNRKIINFDEIECGGIYEITTNQGDVFIVMNIYDCDLYYNLEISEEAFIDLKDGGAMKFDSCDIEKIEVLQGSLVLDN